MMRANPYFKARAHEILFGTIAGDRTSGAVNLLIVLIIVLSVVAVMLESVRGVAAEYSRLLRVFELFSVGVFTVEYILRIWCCPVDKRYSDGIRGRLRYAITFMALIDLIAILPFYLPFLIQLDLRFVRVLRLLRLFRLAKLSRYTSALSQLGQVLRSRREHLVITLAGIIIILVLVSGLMFYAENLAQPEKFSSIPETMWWAVCTMTTVGYGDVYPVTILGKLLAGSVSILGLCLFAVPAGIISSGFIELLSEEKNN
jgi:voltage-gated potassium channel